MNLNFHMSAFRELRTLVTSLENKNYNPQSLPQKEELINTIDEISQWACQQRRIQKMPEGQYDYISNELDDFERTINTVYNKVLVNEWIEDASLDKEVDFICEDSELNTPVTPVESEAVEVNENEAEAEEEEEFRINIVGEPFDISQLSI